VLLSRRHCRSALFSLNKNASNAPLFDRLRVNIVAIACIYYR